MRIVIKIIKIIVITLLSLAALAILTWGVITYLLWPKPELLELVPGTPLAYVAASDIDGALLAARNSEFADRLARSPIWKSSLSRYWRKMKKQRRNWERQTQLSIDLKGIAQLVGKDAILAFYGDEEKLDFLLVSEVGTLTRMNIKSGSAEKDLKKVYKLTKEKYRGAELITLAIPEIKFSYGFIGRVGLLSTDISLLKKCVDLHKGLGQGMAATSEFKKLAADLPESDISFQINMAKIRDAADHPIISPLMARVKADPLFSYLTPVTEGDDTWAGSMTYLNGDLTLDLRTSYTPPKQNSGMFISHATGMDDLANHDLPVPADCLFFGLYEMLDVGILFEMVESLIGIDLDNAKDKLLPSFQIGAAVAVLKPNIKELQLLPPMMIIFQLKDKAVAQAALEALDGSITVRNRQLRFAERKHANTKIMYTRIPIGMGLSLEAGYAFIGDDLLVLATDTSALEAAVDVSLNKEISLMKDEYYASTMTPMAAGKEGRLFLDIVSTAEITRQAGKLYSWRAKFAGDREGEQIAKLLYENIFILEAWRYMGMTFESEDGRTSVKMVLNSQ